MKIVLLPVLLLAAGIASAQTTDSVVIHRYLAGELNASSKKTTEGRPFSYMPVNMAAGDMLYVVLKSMDFVTMVGVQDTSGAVIAHKTDTETFYKTIGSNVQLSFKAATARTVMFFFLPAAVTSLSENSPWIFTITVAHETKCATSRALPFVKSSTISPIKSFWVSNS